MSFVPASISTESGQNIMGLSYTGNNCLRTAIVIEKNLVPEPPANIIPFISPNQGQIGFFRPFRGDKYNFPSAMQALTFIKRNQKIVTFLSIKQNAQKELFNR